MSEVDPERSVEQINKLLADELAMTMAALKSHPKVYWIWNHRRWCLEHVPDGPGGEGEETHIGWKKSAWDQELYVVEKLLDADARNCKSQLMWRECECAHGFVVDSSRLEL